MPPEGGHRCGFVAVVGRPNVGKSTLVNALVGRKVSIVSRRPQTTRQRVTGVASGEASQVLFVDTPGLHRMERRALNRAMNRAALSSLADADLVLMVVEAGRWTEEDDDVLARVQERGRKIVLVVNKVDRVWPKERLLPYIEAVAQHGQFEAIVPVSAERGSNLDRLQSLVEAAMPEGPALYPEDQFSDRDEHFHAAEIIREKLMRRLHEELPYGLTVQIERMAPDDQGRLGISAIVWVERENHKPIVIGKGGEMLKSVGRAARLELKERYGRSVHLELWVKVREGWSDRDEELRRLGFDSD